MKTENTYLWRTKWAGKWGTTRYHCTEEHIRKEHPEAVCVESSLIVREVPETKAESDAMQSQMQTNPSVVRRRADGSYLKSWEKE